MHVKQSFKIHPKFFFVFLIYGRECNLKTVVNGVEHCSTAEIKFS